jgi:hypothetical protein
VFISNVIITTINFFLLLQTIIACDRTITTKELTVMYKGVKKNRDKHSDIKKFILNGMYTSVLHAVTVDV